MVHLQRNMKGVFFQNLVSKRGVVYGKGFICTEICTEFCCCFFLFFSPKSGLNLKREAVHGHGVLHKDMNYEWKVFEKVILDMGWSFMRVVFVRGSTE